MEETPKDASQHPRKGWQRVTPQRTQSRSVRETFRRDAPSPVEEVLAKHDAELDDRDDNDDETQVFCF